ncbi:MAG: NrpR regulatory domain-containing protein, partial [Dehalococcoidia bacterium]|nr:NrpR regulatory domain-containing protein [Dehalococcoidia bacterium]
LSILKVLRSLQKPAGARIIERHLKDYGILLGERAVRYHLRLMDERGLTELVGKRDGRIITEKGLNEIKSAMVKDKVGFAIAKIEMLSFRTNFDYENRRGAVPVNVSIFPKENFKKALLAMRPVFERGYCVSQLVATADSGQRLGDILVPDGRVGLATVCSIVINGTLLKAGIPMDSRFGGILQINNGKPTRFTEIIHYNGCSLDPSEIFIKAKMTSVREAVSTGNGEILANFREVPAICMPVVNRVLEELRTAGLGGVIVSGSLSENVCEIPVDPNKIGLVLVGGLNPVAAAQEVGIVAENYSMSTVVEYRDLVKITEL